MSTAKEIGTALAANLATILSTNGYKTDMGLRVYKGRRSLDDSLIPCVVLAELPDQVADAVQHGTQILVTQQYVMEAHVPCDPNNPNDAAHDAIEDMKRLVFQGLKEVGNLGRFFSDKIKTMKYVGKAILPRQDGTAYVGAALTIECTFRETLTSP